nr:hemogen isoform X1 [Misgurnus anguillicaudatus]
MEETLDKEIPPTEVKLSNEGGIRLRLRDRDLLKKRKAEAEEKATNQWVYGAQSIKRAKKKSSGTPGRKGRPRKQHPVVVPEEDICVGQEIGPTSVTLPVPLPALSTEVETTTLQPAEPQPVPVFVETIKEKPLETFLIEDLGPDEEEDMPPKRLIIDTGDDEQRWADAPEQSQASVSAFPPATVSSYPESLPENIPEPLI